LHHWALAWLQQNAAPPRHRRRPTSPPTSMANLPCPKRTPRKSGGPSQRGLGNAAGRRGVAPSKEAK